jgi:hypothetical protein
VLSPTANDPPDSWRLFAEWLPILAPGRRQDHEVFERSNKRLNRVFGNLIGPWTQRCTGQPTVAGTTVGIPGRVRLLARGRPSARGLQARRSDGGFLVRGPSGRRSSRRRRHPPEPGPVPGQGPGPRGRGWGEPRPGQTPAVDVLPVPGSPVHLWWMCGLASQAVFEQDDQAG